jgi:Ca-activated chloride channel family protein
MITLVREPSLARALAMRALAVLAAVVCLGQVPPLAAQDARPTFRSSVAVVPITAVVRDSRNRIVRDLSRRDFNVLENSRPRPILDFKAADDGPVSLALLVDTSGSMRGPHLESARTVAEHVLTSLNPASDEVALFTFDKALRQETPFTDDSGHVRQALDQTDAWGLTSLYDAIADTAKRLAERQGHRHALIVITDGVDTSSSITPMEVSGLASAIDVPVYVVAVAPPHAANVSDEEGDLAYLANWTGGDVRYVVSPAHAEKTATALVAELRHQYFLAIESAAATGWHRLDVRTARRGLTVRTRSGYFARSSHTSGE